MLDFALQHPIGRKADGVEVSFLLQERVDVWVGEGGVSSEKASKLLVTVASNHRLEHRAPVVRAVDVPLAQYRPLQVPELVEAEQWMVAATSKVTVVCRALLTAIRLAHRAVHVEDDLALWFPLPQPVDPLSRKVHQGFQILTPSEDRRLEPTHLTGRCGVALLRPAAYDMAHCRVYRQPLRIVGVFVSCQAAEHRLPQQGNSSFRLRSKTTLRAPFPLSPIRFSRSARAESEESLCSCGRSRVHYARFSLPSGKSGIHAL